MIRFLRTIPAIALALSLPGALLAQAPANDNCADAIELNGEVADMPFSTVNANTDGPAHPDDCPSAGSTPDSVYNDIWYRFTPDWTGKARFSTCGTANFDTKIMVYAAGAACPPDVADVIGCNEDGANCANSTSQTEFDVTSGETYLLRLGGWGSGSPGEEGEGTFSVTEFIPAVPNDECTDAIVLDLGDNDSLMVAFSNVDATTGLPVHSTPISCFEPDEKNVYNDIWYTWTATFTGWLEWSLCGTANFDSRIAVYGPDQPCPPDPSALVGCGDDDTYPNGVTCPGYTSRDVFPVEEGKNYLFRLGGWSGGDEGIGTFTVYRTIPPIVPPNDGCEAPDSVFVMTESDANDFIYLFQGFTFNGSGDPGTPAPACDDVNEYWDVWYKFNSGENTVLQLRFNDNSIIDGSAFDIELYDDCGMQADLGGAGFCVKSEDFSETYFESMIEGLPGEPTEYYLRIASNVTSAGPGEFWFQLVGMPYSSSQEPAVENFRFYPNPVTGVAHISFNLLEAVDGQVEVVNALGQVVHRQDYGRLAAGKHYLTYSTENLRPGMYFYRLAAGDKQKVVNFVKE
ncbi:MAG: T9SS type A sorting domain-containing protein [Phaeodactylibacter sp.]|nr:T9SS type A sorting domain-containing protein [Phaeodactylibacter sp.]MCB9272590.1 T9SS type A sorting domain-containing protein [Lewinellaceae bacterium]